MAKSDTVRSLADDDDAVAADFFTAPWGTYKPGLLQGFLIGLTRRTVLQRGAAREKMTKLITGLGRPIDTRFRGCKFRIEGRNNLIEYGVLTRPSYNGEEIDFLLGAMEPGGVAIDIGSNIGLYSLPLAKAAGPTGHVLAIDANMDMVKRLQSNAAASNIDCITALPVAVGGTAGRVDLNIRRDDVAIVSVVASETGAVDMLPLSQIVSEAGVARVDALKIDIEGFEDTALVPYLQEAPEHLRPRRIVIELCAPETDYPGCLAEFNRLGYSLRGRTRNNSMYGRD